MLPRWSCLFASDAGVPSGRLTQRVLDMPSDENHDPVLAARGSRSAVLSPICQRCSQPNHEGPFCSSWLNGADKRPSANALESAAALHFGRTTLRRARQALMFSGGRSKSCQFVNRRGRACKATISIVFVIRVYAIGRVPGESAGYVYRVGPVNLESRRHQNKKIGRAHV